ncbi:MAG: nuclear transport factor 2 family protein [Desulfuromonadaceae bacterium]|nr:nuclear transport factor 2 family protein [Desulfuromonadaceae bacterium]
MPPDEMKTLIQRYIEAYNRMNVDELLATVHPDVAFTNVSGGVVNASTTGISELRALALQSLSLFSERQQIIESFQCEGPKALVSVAFRAVVANDLPNGLKSGQVLNLSGRSEFEFRDGAIYKITDIS